ncbi:hemagglutinin repeat-containing protein [Xanthomonas oryzae pv. oryzicola]|nr:hemagglutinin repeat-containing protein [Xanthomonas oryzae pv. oryzicola]
MIERLQSVAFDVNCRGGPTHAQEQVPVQQDHHHARRTHDSLAVTSSLSGESVRVAAGNDLRSQGSQIVGTGDVVLAAGNNLTLETAQSTHSESHDKQTVKSGLMGSGGIGFTIGKQTVKTEADTSAVSHTGSTVGSLEGNVTLAAGNTLAITGSDVMALQGDITAKAKDIAITEVHDTSDSTQKTAFKQGGLTVSLSSAALNLAQAAVSSAEAGKKAQGDTRMQALAGASAAYSAYGAGQAMGSALSAGSAKDAAQGAGLKIAVTVGGSKSQSQTTQQSATTKGSTLQAGGNVNLIATGGGEDSNILVRGSDLKAGNNLLLSADHDITLEAAQDSFEQHSTSKSSSAAIGVAVTYGADGFAAGVTVSASGARGKADGQDITQRNSHLSAGNTATLISGNDTTLKGAVLSANTVLADIGGDLNIESLQDTSTYTSKDKAVGGSVTFGMGFSASGSYSSNKVNGDFASVKEQSGIQAGDGGFDIRVHGNTDLKGAVIASTQAAVDAGANRLQTGTLTVSDITNTNNYKATGISLSGGYAAGGSDGKAGGKTDTQTPPTTNNGSNWSWQNQGSGVQGASAGFSSKSGSSTSTTASGISGGTVVITDQAGQQAKTGQSVSDVLAALNRDVHTGDSANGLVKGWDGQKLQQQVSAGAEITATFGQQASKFVGDYATTKANQLRLQGNEEEAAKWDEGGEYRVAAHTAVGLLGGGVQGALGSATAATAAPMLNELTKNLPDGVREAVGAGLAAGLGAVTGGGAGAATAFNADTNNRQLHQDSNQNEVARLKEMANGDPQREADLVASACALVKCSAEYPDGSDEKKYWAAIEVEGNKPERQEDRDWLKSQSQTTYGYAAGSVWEENKHLFAYDGVDAIGDWATKNQVGARALGGLQMLGGAAESAGAIMLAPTCETGIGCVASVYLTGAGADNAAAGAITLFSGKATSTLGGQALQALGLQPGTAELLYGFTQMAPSVGAAIAANRAINLEIASNAWARSTYTGDGAVDYKGLIYRYTSPEYAEGTWRMYPGNISANHRYSPEGIGAIYAGTKSSTAAAEVASYDALDGKILVSKNVNVGGVLDLTNPAVRKALVPLCYK